jgi:cell division septal protein FtsQ
MSVRNRKFLSPPLLITVVTLLALAYLLGWSSFFSVKGVEISGAPTPAVQVAIEKQSQVAVGQQLARVNPQSAARKIEKSPWIKDVKISRDWLSGVVRIEVTPREPLAFFNSDQVPGQTIDEDGQLFSLPGYTNPDLALISAKSPESALKANELFTQLPENFRAQITSMLATSSNTFTLNCIINGREIRIRWGDNQDMALKISVINKLLKLPENKRINLIDVVAPYAPIVK